MNRKISLILIALYISNVNGMELSQEEHNIEQKIDKNYIELFPDLIDKICKSEPGDLFLNSYFQTMPSLFDTFVEMRVLEMDSINNLEDFSKTKEYAYLLKYLELIAEVTISDFEQKNLLLDKLIQKLGENLGFLCMVSTITFKTPTFTSKLKEILGKYEFLRGNSPDFILSIVESDPEWQSIQNKLNALQEKFNYFIDLISQGNITNIEMAGLKIESSDEEAEDEESSSVSISSTEESSKEEE